ncbi:Sef1p SCDLUD_000183 [Saccharomycodes ludwigii]|uniref:Sef1p n=1 Tax=Saccharomycodes ludwigii TaxID=36035 RepID=UPI001E8BC71E|nr:hypothetical protein SCDLUD_000183 [Saccharomycodes ludwigii]KAH3902603.1 hypothetical protein SCDLUD_000183 [Saccharomycodes ludwigii]
MIPSERISEDKMSTPDTTSIINNGMISRTTAEDTKTVEEQPILYDNTPNKYHNKSNDADIVATSRRGRKPSANKIHNTNKSRNTSLTSSRKRPVSNELINNKSKIIKTEENIIQGDHGTLEDVTIHTNIKNNGDIQANICNDNKRANLALTSIKKQQQQQQQHTGHRPVTSCTHCRQHKIKCNASDNFPSPCSRCQKMGLHCEIDPQFRPKKGSQLQCLRNDVDELKLKIEYLTRNEGLIAKALKKTSQGEKLINEINKISFSYRVAGPQQGQLINKHHINTDCSSNNSSLKAANSPNNDNFLMEYNNSTHTPPTMTTIKTPPSGLNKPRNNLFNNSSNNNIPPVLKRALNKLTNSNIANNDSNNNNNNNTNTSSIISSSNGSSPLISATNIKNNSFSISNHNNGTCGNSMVTTAMPLLPSPHATIDEFVLGDVHIPISKATELHHRFVTKYLPYFPIITSTSATELYSQSQLLFWTVMLTACLSDPEPTLYNKLASLIKQLAIETCWIRTPRSTHISQALLILCLWPLPNQKVLDDCSYRFVGLAKSLSFQLGLHRGKFMTEFSRTQTSMPQAEKWRTRTWLGIFFAEQCWASILGLPPTSQTDYLIEQGTRTNAFDLPSNFKKLLCLASFQAKLYSVMGSSVASPDGLLDARDRAGSLAILERELGRLALKLDFGGNISVEIYYLYVKLMICCYVFLPDTPSEDQSRYVTEAYLSATRVITLVTKLLETQQLLELPIYVRQSCTYSALILFKLYLTPLLLDKYVDSARQSIVTVHRLYRNQLTAWATSVENDISRTASVLEKLNFVLITHPEVFNEEEGIITRMRSHLTGTLFYDLVWCVHEARRRELDPNYKHYNNRSASMGEQRKLYPLPFYNQISKEYFEAITKTTPGGTTVTTLVPTKTAIKNAQSVPVNNTNGGNGVNKQVMAINGIPITMLDETGSMRLDSLLENPVGVDAKIGGNTYNAEVKANDNINAGHLGNITNVPLNRSLSASILAPPNSISRSYTPVSSINTPELLPANTTGDVLRSELQPSRTYKSLSTASTAVVSNSLPAQNKTDIDNRPTKTSTNSSDNSLFQMNNSLSSNLTLNRSYSHPQPLPSSLDKNAVNNNPISDTNSSNNTVTSSLATAAKNTDKTITMQNSATAENSGSSAHFNPSLNIFGKSTTIPSNTSNNGVTINNANSIVNINNSSEQQPPPQQQQQQLLNDLDAFLQQQTAGWIEGNSNNDDFLGWFDMNMAPEF